MLFLVCRRVNLPQISTPPVQSHARVAVSEHLVRAPRVVAVRWFVSSCPLLIALDLSRTRQSPGSCCIVLHKGINRLPNSSVPLSSLAGSKHPTCPGSTVVGVVVPPDLMLNAAMISNLHDGAISTAGVGPCDDTGIMDAAIQSHGEHSRETRKECCLSMAG